VGGGYGGRIAGESLGTSKERKPTTKNGEKWGGQRRGKHTTGFKTKKRKGGDKQSGRAKNTARKGEKEKDTT